MKKWKMLGIFAYFVPWVLFVLTKLFTRWGHDIENCIFAFFVGLLIQCLIGIWGLIGIRKEVTMYKERTLFLISVVPLFFIIVMFFVSRSYLVKTCEITCVDIVMTLEGRNRKKIPM